MSDNRNDLTDDEISEMMKTVKRNLNKRNQNLVCQPPLDTNSTADLNNSISFGQDLSFIHQNSNIQNDSYEIKSHRPVFGYFLVKGRELVNAEIKRYLGPILFKQSLINGTLVRIINEIKKSVTQNQDKLGLLESSLTQNQDKFGLLESSLTQNQDRLNQMDQLLKDQLSSTTAENDRNKLEIIRMIDERFAKYDSYLKPIEVTRWSTLYSKDISEKNLIENIEYHTYFIDLIRNYAKSSAKSKVPKLIEIGLGNGTMSIFFSRNELCEVYGIDNDIDVLRYCINNNKKMGGYAKFVLMDAFDLNLFNKKQFDVAFSQGTLEHFNNESIIALLSKQLAVAHYVIFSVPSVNWTTREIGNERKMTLEEWRTLLNEGGFNILKLEYYKEDLHIVGVISE